MNPSKLPSRMQAYLAVAQPTTLVEDLEWAEKARSNGVPEVIIENTLLGRKYDRENVDMPSYIGKLLAAPESNKSLKERAHDMRASQNNSPSRRNRTTFL